MHQPDVENVLETIAEKTNLFAGCDIEDLVIRAKQCFFNDKASKALLGRHLTKALEDSVIDISKRKELMTEYKAISSSFTNSLRFLESMTTT